MLTVLIAKDVHAILEFGLILHADSHINGVPSDLEILQFQVGSLAVIDITAVFPDVPGNQAAADDIAGRGKGTILFTVDP